MPRTHDHPPDAFDDLLADAEAHVTRGNPAIEVTLSVPLAPTTLDALTSRAAREGRDITDVIADALRAAAA